MQTPHMHIPPRAWEPARGQKHQRPPQVHRDGSPSVYDPAAAAAPSPVSACGRATHGGAGLSGGGSRARPAAAPRLGRVCLRQRALRQRPHGRRSPQCGCAVSQATRFTAAAPAGATSALSRGGGAGSGECYRAAVRAVWARFRLFQGHLLCGGGGRVAGRHTRPRPRLPVGLGLWAAAAPRHRRFWAEDVRTLSDVLHRSGSGNSDCLLGISHVPLCRSHVPVTSSRGES